MLDFVLVLWLFVGLFFYTSVVCCVVSIVCSLLFGGLVGYMFVLMCFGGGYFVCVVGLC